MEQEIRSLESAIEKMQQLNDALKKRQGEPVGQMLMYKKIEDGMIENFHIMTDHQIKNLLRGFKFKWYKELNSQKVLEDAIKKAKRKDVLRSIL